MDAGIIVTLLVGLAAPLLDLLEKGGVSRLVETTPLQAAAQRTGEAFPEVEGCAETLLEWCDQESFLDLLDGLRGGDRNAEDANDVAIASVFVESTRFDFGDETLPKASEVVSNFLRNLKRELYESAEGVALLATRGEVIYDETLTAIRQQGDRVIAEVGAALGRVATDTPDATPGAGPPPSADEGAFVPQLDAARDLLRAGKAKSALDLLSRLERETAAGKKISEESLCRLALNLGSANLELGMLPEALRQYNRALELRPTDSRALFSAAKARLMLNEPDKALELADRSLVEDPASIKALGMRLLALHQLGRDGEVDLIVEASPQLAESPLGSAILGELRLSQRRFSEAVPLLRRGLASDEVQLPRVRMLIAVALVNTVKYGEGWPTPAQMEEERQQATLREAEEYFDRALEDMESSDDRSTYRDTLASRAGVRAMLGNDAGAFEDCDRVLGEKPGNALAIENKARILLLARRPAEAFELLERLPAPIGTDTSLLKANVLLRMDRAADALPLAVDAWDEDNDDVGSQIQAADILLAAEARLGIDERSSLVLNRLQRDWPEHPLALAVRAEAAERAENLDDAIALLNQAIQIASGRTARQLTYQLASLHCLRGEFSDAVAAYRQVAPPAFSDPEFRNYLVTLLRAGNLADVVSLCREAREEIGPVLGIADIEAHVLQIIGDLPASEALLEELSQRSPADIGVRLELLSLRLRMGKHEAAKEVAQAIRNEEVWDNPDYLLDLAEARQILKLPDALELAFRGRRIGFDSSLAHKRYMALFLNREKIDEALLSPSEVQVGCAVHLRHDEEEIVLTILDDEDVTRSRGEIGPNDDLLARLQSLRVGDRVSVGPDPTALEYTVEKIQSKYVEAFQQTLLNFPVWFPAESDFFRIDVKENDLSDILLLVDERHRAAEQVMALYRTKPVTVGVVAELLGRSVIDVWTGLVGIVGEKLIASVGSEDEAAHDAAAVQSASAFAVDVVAVLTLAHLGLLKRLAESVRLLAPQSVITDIRLHYLTNFEGATPTGILSKDGGQYVRGEITEEDIERGRAFISGILEVLEDRTEVTPVKAALDLDPGEYEKLQATLGASSTDAILVARGMDGLLLSDDLRLRQLASSTFGVEGTWTQPVLSYLVDGGFLTRDEYLSAILTLLLSNYRHPKVSADDISELLEKTGLQLTPQLEACLQSALGPDYREESVLGVAATLIAKLWRQPISEQRGGALVGAVIASVVQPRAERRRILTALVAVLENRFRLDPLGFDRLARFIRGWAAAHYI